MYCGHLDIFIHVIYAGMARAVDPSWMQIPQTHFVAFFKKARLRSINCKHDNKEKYCFLHTLEMTFPNPIDI